MIVNMYVDHLMASPPTSPEDVWNATHQHQRLFSEAAARIGMTPAQYAEFRKDLMDGKATYVRLPRRVDAMSGQRNGSVYAVHNAVMTTPQMGWRVRLADGSTVYVPRVCSNLSFTHAAVIAKAPHVPVRHVAYATPGHKKKTPAYVQAVAETPVSLEAPAPEAPATVAQAVPAAGHGFPFFAFIPAAIGGIAAAVAHPSSTAPPCTNGSNTMGVCSSSR